MAARNSEVEIRDSASFEDVVRSSGEMRRLKLTIERRAGGMRWMMWDARGRGNPVNRGLEGEVCGERMRGR
jgi:hypothetical protein